MRFKRKNRGNKRLQINKNKTKTKNQ